MMDDVLLQVQKPARYIGKEWNVCRKDFESARVTLALCFPDLYEVGMSNAGMRIMYGILNNIEDVACERCFACGTDMENILRAKGLHLCSLETGHPLREFDMLGFSLGCELSYTNVLNMLELGGVPLKAAERTREHPLVIAGGPCVMNPEPMSAFFDFFVIGEAEEAIIEVVDLYRKRKEEFKSGAFSRKALLQEYARIEGVYVPSLYEVKYDSLGAIKEFKPTVDGVSYTVRKRIVKDLENSHYPAQWLVPYIQIVHDRIAVEIMRGCPHRCRFCQARSQYFPFRVRKMDRILKLAEEMYRSTGYEEVSLVGLSVSDYPGIEEAVQALVRLFNRKAVSISLPSMRPKSQIGNIPRLIASIKKTAFTFAPEAATEKLRKIIGKDFDMQGLFEMLEQIYASGYQRVKLYFMIGLPGEEKGDLDAIVECAQQVSLLRKKLGKPAAEVTVSINAIIPKAHTPFQWIGAPGMESVIEKQNYLLSRVRNCRRIKLDFHNPWMAVLEGVFSRGDRKLCEVVLNAFRNNARFDSWQNHFSFEAWERAFRQAGIGIDSYLAPKDTDAFLPWDFIDIGISKDSLRQEYGQALNKTIALT